MATSGQGSRYGLAADAESMSRLDWLAVALAGATGIVHLHLFRTVGWVPFLLAGVGYAGLIAGVLVSSRYRRLAYPLAALFTLGQIVGYLLVPLGPAWIGYLDKAIQVLLLFVLAQLFGKSVDRPRPPDRSHPR